MFMEPINIDDDVELEHDLPELGLLRGEIGRVCSTWCCPANAYEVEFHTEPGNFGLRALLMPDMLARHHPAAGRREMAESAAYEAVGA
jgi:hypothetical protein